jgi:hypothetical protein
VQSGATFEKPAAAIGTALACAVLLFSGAAGVAAQVSSPNVPTIDVVDTRPAIEGMKKTLSLWIGSCDYFVVRVDDKAMSVGRIDQLRADLAQKLGSRLAGNRVTVKHYTMYLNSGVEMVSAAVAAGVGSVGGVMLGGRPAPRAKCAKEKMTAGWFDSSEVTTNKPPLITEAEIEFRGKTYRSRYVYSPEKEFNEVSGNPKYGAIKADIFRIINLDLATQIERDLP